MVVERWRFVAILVAVALLLALGFIGTHLLKLQGYGEQWGFRRLLNMSGEGNLPAWYSASLMLLAGALLAVIAIGKSAGRDPYRAHWWVLSAGFVYMAADEAASIHEMLNRLARVLPIQDEGALGYPWVVVGGSIVLVLAAFFLRFVTRLNPDIRWRVVLSGALFVGGAIGVEMVGARLADAQALYTDPLWEERGDFTSQYMIAVSIEETLELLGIIAFIDALLRQLRMTHRSIRVEVA